MPRPPELGGDVVDLTNDSEPEDDPCPVPGPRQNQAHHNGQLSAAARQQMYKAIETCPEDRLRDVLANMVADDAVSTQTLFENLVAANPPPLPAAEPGVDDAEGAPEILPRWTTCKRCGETFDLAEEREEDECVYHPGYLKVNYEEWPDHDEDVHGPMDNPQNRRDYPQGFQWTCCKVDGNSAGCTEGTHVPEVSKKRRTRY
ncbi:hypothetical protein DAEQUDRAFT_507068 [Daedalea quercina L-15889]|uniref:C2H2-type domain-containing protein n=1 Tax=Daedalea quercina L-15889 TaxID=1314783 RepID=A0A165T9G4_9APHY|nr:hypothetical protein DAEQUDRAFT_507068 [Daedalea quercina L-15889]